MIPRVIHQIWIGAEPPPAAMMATWQKFCRDRRWTYQLWNDPNDALFAPVRARMDALPNAYDKADCMRFVILGQMGGVYADADTTLIRPLDDSLLTRDFFAYEHELVRPALFSNTMMGFEPGSDIMRDCVEAVASRTARSALKPGSYLLTDVLALHNRRRLTGVKVRDVRFLPSRHFNPVHWTGAPAPGVALPRNGRVDPSIYTVHAWHSTTARPAKHDPRDGTQAEGLALVEQVLGIREQARLARAAAGHSDSALEPRQQATA